MTAVTGQDVRRALTGWPRCPMCRRFEESPGEPNQAHCRVSRLLRICTCDWEVCPLTRCLPEAHAYAEMMAEWRETHNPTEMVDWLGNLDHDEIITAWGTPPVRWAGALGLHLPGECDSSECDHCAPTDLANAHERLWMAL